MRSSLAFLLGLLWWNGCGRLLPVSEAFAPQVGIRRGNDQSLVSRSIGTPISKPNGGLAPLYILSPYRTSSSTRTTGTERIPFVIEELPEMTSESVYKEVSRMCITAFFNDGDKDQRVPFWKELQLGYLRTLQQADLRRRRNLKPDTNMMFVARRVLPATEFASRTTPLLLDLSKVNNLATQRGDFVRGDVLGFVEVTQRSYGLGGEQLGLDDESRAQLRTNSHYSTRPVLTNLSVDYEARGSGVGGRLLEKCEQQVQRKWFMNEIILEVEDDNINALNFYTKRGYKELFEDPASRRYDTNGLILRQLRVSDTC
jgi:ribosomal protein S18 acetylase RimI-like enzyme